MIKPYNKPDLNAPRRKSTRLDGANIKFYHKFFKKHPEHKHLSNMDVKRILVAFNMNIKDVIIQERDGAEFPERLGCSFVGSCNPPVKTNYNQAAALKHGIGIQHTNANSDGFLAKIFYSNYASHYTFKMRELWSFKGNRPFQRELSQVYREKWRQYIQVDNFTNIKNLYLKNNQKFYAKKHIVQAGADYNEFDLS